MAETLTIEQLERWVLSGAHWRVVERRRSHDPEVLGYLGTARSDLDLE